jgi:hypothetical protein
MMNSMIANSETITVGDQVQVIDPVIVQRIGTTSAKVVEIRRVLGEQTYLIELETGERKLLGAQQIRRVQPSAT